jgi:hypothetical protein
MQITARRMSIHSTSSEDSGTAVDVDQVFYHLHFFFFFKYLLLFFYNFFFLYIFKHKNS